MAQTCCWLDPVANDPTETPGSEDDRVATTSEERGRHPPRLSSPRIAAYQTVAPARSLIVFQTIALAATCPMQQKSRSAESRNQLLARGLSPRPRRRLL